MSKISLFSKLAFCALILVFVAGWPGKPGLAQDNRYPVGWKPQGEWQLIFSDEFDNDALDGDKWVRCYWWDDNGCTNAGNNEMQWYRPENVAVEDGVLRLRAAEQRVAGSDGKTYAYTSGMVTTGSIIDNPDSPPRFSFRYGYVEIRAKIPRGQGLWPAFWMLPDDQTSKPEIDVLEVLGHEPDLLHMALHYLNSAGERERAKQEWRGPDFSENWHIFAARWNDHSITWYVDGEALWRYDRVRYIPKVSMYLLLNLAVGGDWPGAPDSDTIFPADYLIDYVRVWAAVQ